ncbi:uncharacterized protein BDZ99DRAFT_522805 [Mytilinidion resinicola]|uniref:Cora-domain-containing protein n=1 Tax=Mytilinidion resinicola TaxID=574789 RepID=A0A6A6YED7_9PEZI|nr:uncharacterized protein BDZ99DRAFT_522805 [Mytilinidion resinicola]KAF2807182.1 hypothetical protein BDZ99DRAFT_522805 [Mytilinidion resinicola]
MAAPFSIRTSLARPEIEDPKQFRSVLDSNKHFSPSSSFDLLDTGNSTTPWMTKVTDEVLRNNIECANEKNAKTFRTRVFFLSMQNRNSNSKSLNMSASSFRSIVKTYAIPNTFVERIFKDMIWDGNGCFLSQSPDGHPEKFELFYRSECGFHSHPQTAFVVDFTANTATYILINCPDSAKTRIVHYVTQDSPHVLDRPLGLDALLLDECLKAWEDRVDHYRGKLLSYESQNPKDDHSAPPSLDSDADSATNTLHKLCTKTHRMFEHLADLEACGIFLRTAHERYNTAIQASNAHRKSKSEMGEDSSAWSLDRPYSVSDSFAQLLSGIDTCKRWTDNYKSRTSLYENMLWHADVQKNNEINERNAVVQLQNAAVNLRISRLTKEDSKSMIALSVLAMLFLPGTFVAGIFSMAFFTSPTAQDFGASKWIWLYFAVTVPLTAGSFVAWGIWKRRGMDGKRTNLRDLENGLEMNGTPLRKITSTRSS